MLSSQRLQLEQSERPQKINDLLGQDDLSDDQRNELDSLIKRRQQIEVELRAAIVAEAANAERMATEFANAGLVAETRERLRNPTDLTKNPIALEQESNGLDARSAQPVVSPCSVSATSQSVVFE